MLALLVVIAASVYTVHDSGGEGQAASAAVQASTDRPNIVVIMTDDQRADDMKVMTHVDELLVKQGTTFRNSFVSYSLCCPSRATFLTGQYAHNHRVAHNLPPSGGYRKLDHTNTLAVWLQQAGYHTVHIGKFLNGYGSQVPPETVPPGWSEWYGTPDPGSHRFYEYYINENGVLVFYGRREADYQTDVLARHAVKFIHRMATFDMPFFLSFAPLAPHDDSANLNSIPGPEPALRHIGVYQNEPLPQPPSFNEQDVSSKPSGIRALSLLDEDSVQELTASYRRRLESLLAVDEAVKAIIDALEMTAQLAKTVMIFTSDNGFLQGEHRVKNQKLLPYEESIRVPLIIKHPGFTGNRVRDELVQNIDLAPTIVELAQAAATRVMDGRSLVPLLHDAIPEWRRHILVESNIKGPGSRKISYMAVRTVQYVYVQYKTGEKELYNFIDDACHSADPYQLDSQHTNPCYRHLIADLRQQLAILRRCAGDSCWR